MIIDGSHESRRGACDATAIACSSHRPRCAKRSGGSSNPKAFVAVTFACPTQLHPDLLTDHGDIDIVVFRSGDGPGQRHRHRRRRWPFSAKPPPNAKHWRPTAPHPTSNCPISTATRWRSTSTPARSGSSPRGPVGAAVATTCRLGRRCRRNCRTSRSSPSRSTTRPRMPASIVEAADPDFPVLIDANHAVAEQYGLHNVPSVVWIDEDGKVARSPVIAPGDDQWRDFTSIDSGVHHDQLRQWVATGEVPEDESAVREHMADESPELQEARAERRLGAWLHAQRTRRCGLGAFRAGRCAGADGLHHRPRFDADARPGPVRRRVLRVLGGMGQSRTSRCLQLS